MNEELRMLFEQMSPEMIKQKVDRMAELQDIRPDRLRIIAQEAIDELKFRYSHNDGSVSRECFVLLKCLADSIACYASRDVLKDAIKLFED